nr:MAG TPA: hypothetical protein [Caudoviricetes sp.]
MHMLKACALYIYCLNILGLKTRCLIVRVIK